MRSSLTQTKQSDAVNTRHLEDSILRLAKELDVKFPLIELEATGTTAIFRLASSLAGYGRNYLLFPVTKAGLIAGMRGLAETVSKEELEITLYANTAMAGAYMVMAVEI